MRLHRRNDARIVNLKSHDRMRNHQLPPLVVDLPTVRQKREQSLDQTRPPIRFPYA